MNNILNVTMDTGERTVINVLDIITDTETKIEYVLYNLPNDNSIYASRLIENETTFLLQTIDNNEETSLIQEYLKQTSEGDNK